jgi:nucleoside 2-deoxyribosyltransferase
MYMVYLAGGISGLSYEESVAWREYAKSRFLPHITGLSPMRAKEYLAGQATIADSYPDTLLSSDKAITNRDRFDTIRADMILMNLLGSKRVSIGTMIEIGWANAMSVPIVAVMEPEGNLHDHSMVRECISFRAATLDEGIHVVNSTLTIG